jgi:hypothetical protein
MAEAARYECAGLVHRFMPGLRFDGLWRYAVRESESTLRWDELPLESEVSRASGDPDGAWWCVRRCVAVLGQRAWRLVLPPQALQRCPSIAQVERVLHTLLPGWDLGTEQGGALASMNAIVRALEQGGSALVRLVLQGPRRQGVCWAWVVGVEMRARAPVQAQERALLVVGAPWHAPWGCGYGARLMPGEHGAWVVRSTEGQCLACEAVEVVVLELAP